MKITKDWLFEKAACKDGIKWFVSQKETDSINVLQKLIEQKHLDWANWLIVRTMDRTQRLKYSVFAAEQVIDIFENKYPLDKRPRLAIEATKKVLEEDTKENRSAAYAAAYVTADTAYTDYAVASAANAAADAVYAAADAASAADAAYAAASAAADAVYAASKIEMQLKILNYGLELLRNK